MYKTFKSFPELPCPEGSRFQFFKLFEKDALKKVIYLHLDEEGNLKNPILNFGPHLDGKITLFVGDGEELKEMLHVEKFEKLPLVYDSFKIFLGEGLVISKGELWKRQRRLLTPIFHFKSLTQMPTLITNRTLEFCKELENLNGKEIRPVDNFGQLTLRVVVDCVFGGKQYLDADVLHKLFHDINVRINSYFLLTCMIGDFAKYIPLPNIIYLFSDIRKVKQLVMKSIQMKREELRSGKLSNDSDILSALLLVEDNGVPISDSLIIDESITFLFAGHDTTSSLLSWCMTFLSRDQSIVEKIRNEVAEVCGDRVPGYNDVKKLSYTTMVLRETLRMRPPVPLLDRVLVKDSEICGIKVPANTYTYPVILASHFDKRFWKEPFSFRPERFDPTNKDEPNRPPYVYVPFSANSRNCIGQKFAIMEATLILAIVVSKFNVSSNTPADKDGWEFEGTMKPVDFKCSFTPIK